MHYRAEVAVVGGGIVGLAHAWAAARRGHSVVLFERDRAAQGASVRNFGMIWPIGQPSGEMLDRALRSRARWQQLADEAGLWVNPCGSLHLAYRLDELAVLEEFVGLRGGHDVRLLTPAEAVRKSPGVNPDRLLGALWSTTECCVDPHQAIGRLPHWLAEAHGVQLRYGTTVCGAHLPYLHTTDRQIWKVDRVVICGGVDFQTLFPDVFASSGIRRCKLQMMRTPPQPGGWRLGPHLAGGLTLGHYAAFRACRSLAHLQQRFAVELAEYVRYGIHVMAAQNHAGEVVVGDSHEYDDAIDPFDKPRIDDLILAYLRDMARLPDATIAARWHGIYAKHPTLPLFTAEPQPGVAIVSAPGGAGMTLSFGFADDWWAANGGGMVAKGQGAGGREEKGSARGPRPLGGLVGLP